MTKEQLAEIRARAEKALATVAEHCSSGRPLRLSIPVRPDDSDVVISDALMDNMALCDALTKAQERITALEAVLAQLNSDFEHLERSYGKSLWNTGAGYVLLPRFLALREILAGGDDIDQAPESDTMTAYELPKTVHDLELEAIRGAVARGWCADVNCDKVIDPDLAEAITQELMKLGKQA
jgi:hypothetical protein